MFMRKRRLLASLLTIALLLTALAGTALAAPAPQPLQWTWRSPLPQGNFLRSVVYGGGQFVAVGVSGTIITSPDGSTWTVQNSPTTNNLRSVAYGGGQYVAAGEGGVAMTSPDGVNWAVHDIGSPGWTVAGVTYGTVAGKGLWVAAVLGNFVLTSADGITWSMQPASALVNFTGVTYTGAQFVAWASDASDKDWAYTSVDGVSWTPHLAGTNFIATGVAYDSTSGLLAGLDKGGTIYTTTDLATWKTYTAKSPESVAFGAGKAVAVGDQGNWSKFDGVNWTAGTRFTNSDLYGAAYGAGTFVAVGAHGTILTSADTTTWTERSTNVTGRNIQAITYDGTRFVGVGTTGPVEIGLPSVFTSPDGRTWTATPSPSLPPLQNLTYASGKYLGFTATTVAISNDAQTWQTSLPAGVSAIAGVAYNGSTYVLVSSSGSRVATSTNGTAWQTPPLPGNANPQFYGLGYAGGRFVAVGASGAIYASGDGTVWQAATWTAPAGQPTNDFFTVTHDGSQYLATGVGGTVATSPDGLTWTAHTIDITNMIGSVAYGNGLFVGSASAFFIQGQVVISADGVTWTAQPDPTSTMGVAFGAGTFVLWGNGGSDILTAGSMASATPPATPVSITSPRYGSFTNQPQPAIGGSAPAGSTVAISVDGAPAGTVKLGGSTHWSFTPPAPLADGAHTVSATAAGESTPSVPFTVKTSIPNVVFDPLPGGGITNQNRPTITGRAELGSSVQVYVDGAVAAIVSPDAGGHWRYTPGAALADGSCALKATATDAAGNVGATAEQTLRIKTSIPAVSISPPGGSVHDNRPTVSGSAEVGSTVRVYLNGGFSGAGPADGQGAWSVTLPPLPDGQLLVSASATDAAGNVGWSNTVTLQVDTPAQPVAITSPNGGTVTGNNRPTVTGTAKAGSTVSISLDGTKVGEVAADNSGRFRFTPGAALAEGSHTVSASAVDHAGNSSSTPAIPFTVKTGVPAVTLALPGSTLSSPLTPGGTAEVGSTVRVYLDGALAATVQPDAQAHWQASVAAADGSHTVTATATDAAGNAGTAPALTVLVVPAVSVTTLDGARFTSGQPVLTGTAQPGSTVRVSIDGLPRVAITAGASGQWSYTLPAIAPGSHTVGATVTDSSGLTGTAAPHQFTVITLTDIADDPARDAITALAEQGILAGFPDGSFRPEIGVTREQMAVVYARALGLQPESVSLLHFADDNQIGAWAAPYVAAMVHTGLLVGYPDGSFHPGATIRRSELALLLAKVLQQRGIRVAAPAPAIADPLPAWAAEGIRTATAAGLMTPGPDGAFAPDAPATRGQTAQAFYRLFQLLQGH